MYWLLVCFGVCVVAALLSDTVSHVHGFHVDRISSQKFYILCY